MSYQPIEPFTVEMPNEQLDDLRRRIQDTRWPEPETGPGQGAPLARMRRLAAYWANGYDWRRLERMLGPVPQFRTEIGGLGIHFAHLRSQDPGATPLVLTHGWPGSYLEFLEVIGPLSETFHVVCPSLPGYGFSDRPGTTGWGIERIADAWVELMDRLGYQRFVAAGSDWGTSISTMIAIREPERLLGLHLVPPLVGPVPDSPVSDAEQRSLDDLAERSRTGSAYGEVHATRPQTIGYALTDSPIGLGAWIAEKYADWVDPAGPGVSDDRLLDTVTLYWLTRTAASSVRLYAESIAQVGRWFTEPPTDRIGVPCGGVVFPAEVPRPSRRWAERRFTRIVHWAEPPVGGHFAALEVPDRYVAELRSTQRALSIFG